MANPNWHERLMAALHRQGLPKHYVDRLAAELADHATDIFMEEASMDAHVDIAERLGSPQQLAVAAGREFQQRTFAGRHPAVTFLAGPVVALVATFLLSVLLVITLVWLLDVLLGGVLGANDLINQPPNELEMSVMHTANALIRFLPFVSTGLLFFWLGRRTNRPIWGTVACGIVAIMAICFHSAIHPPGVYDVKGTWTLGLAVQTFGFGQILQAIAPVLLGGLFCCRISTDRR